MKRRGKTTLTTPKTKVTRGLRHKQNESSDEEPLVVPKVIKQYTRKKKVDSTESINNLACKPTVKVGATWSEQSNSVSLVNNQNHVKIKEEIMERYPEIMAAHIETGNHVKTEERSVSQNGRIEDNSVKIKEEITERYPDKEIMAADIETGNHVTTEERNVSQSGSIEDNSVKIKEEIVNDSIVQNVRYNLELNCTYKKESSHVNKIKETGVSKTNGNIIDMNVHQIGSNNKTNTINVKKENVPDRVIHDSRPTETVMQTKETHIKIESDDDLQCTKLERKSVSRPDAPQSETIPVEIKQETEENDCDSYNTNDKMDSSCNEDNEEIISIHKPQILQANSNVKAAKSKILITEEIHIKEEVITKPEINSAYVKNKATVVNEKKQQVLDKEPALGNVKLKRVINMPRLLRTYGRKQPETPETLKKCFLVAVHPQSVLPKFKDIVTPEQLAKIQEKAAKAKVLNCDMCGKNFRSKASVSGHMRFVHSVAMKHKCHVCPASFPHHYLLLAHVRYHSGPPLVCDLCSKCFKTKERYGEHLNTHLRERLFPCPVCLRRYATLTHLHRHAEKHTQEDTFPCGTCNETYRSIIDLTRHSERDHGEKAEFPCYVCNRILSSNADFLTHVKIHDNVIYPCAFCPRRFNDTQKWEEHSNEHIEKIGNGETLLKPYTCKYCRKSFEYQSILKTHLRVHTGERPYQCPVCYKKVKTQSYLTEHVNGHNKPFPCQVCDRRFGKKDSLSRHMLLHTGERPHACTGCSRTFVQRSSMLQHKRRFHEPGLKRARKTKKKNVKKTKKN